MAKLRVGLLFGGRSVEHEVSIASATSIARALDPARYEVLPIWVGQDRRWRIGAPGMLPERTARGAESELPALTSNRAIERVTGDAGERQIDLIFPIIHGTNGEPQIGQRASHGCIRLKNADVVEVFEIAEVGTPVWIGE